MEHLPDLHLFVDAPDKVIRFRDIEFLQTRKNKELLLNPTTDQANLPQNTYKMSVIKL